MTNNGKTKSSDLNKTKPSKTETDENKRHTPSSQGEAPAKRPSPKTDMIKRICSDPKTLVVIIAAIIAAIAAIITASLQSITMRSINSEKIQTESQFNDIKLQLEQKQLETKSQFDKLTLELKENELMISQSQLATACMKYLVEGTEKEKIIAIEILKHSAGKLTTNILQAAAASDESHKVKASAIDALGNRGGGPGHNNPKYDSKKRNWRTKGKGKEILSRYN